MENKKSFKLPSKFAQKWLTALRSGEYTQFTGQLIYYKEKYKPGKNFDDLKDLDRDEVYDVICDTSKGCCLGVAAVMLGATADDLNESDMPGDLDPEILERIKYPKQLINIIPNGKIAEKSRLPDILASLNDGLNTSDIERFRTEYPDLNFKHYPSMKYDEELGSDQDIEQISYSFEQIAEFIEDNVEFYEEDVSNEGV